MESVLSRLSAHHNSDGDTAVGVVRLSGILHSDERGALSEVARQLCSMWGMRGGYSQTASYDENLFFLRTTLLELHRYEAVSALPLSNWDKSANRRHFILLRSKYELGLSKKCGR
jgi:hypothetical protein